jgi:hypothetical protein
MEKKELHSMRKHRGLFLVLALGALLGLATAPVQAETITMTVTIGGGPSFVTDPFNTGVPASNVYNVDPVAGIPALNAFLAANGSEYQFISLSGSSNFPGTTQGQLVLSGEVQSVGPGNAVLMITESESAFTSPTGPSGTLKSSSSGNFTNQPAGGGHTADSMFNSTTTPLITVHSTGTSVNQGTNNGPTSVAVAPVATLYTLTNNITFGLSAGSTTAPIDDTFGVTGTITANSSVPEPASLLMMLTGMPIPLVLAGWLRSRRASA